MNALCLGAVDVAGVCAFAAEVLARVARPAPITTPSRGRIAKILEAENLLIM